MKIKSKWKVEFVQWDVLIVLSFIILLEGFIEPGDRSLDYIMRWVFGYIGFNNRNVFFSSFIKFLLPQFGILLLWGNYLHENVVINYELIFTRTRKSYKVLRKYVVQLLINVSVSVLFLETALFVVYRLKGCNIGRFTGLCLDMLLYCIYMDCLIVVINIISLATKNIYGVILTLVVQSLLIEVTYHLLQGRSVSGIYYVLPTSPAMLMQNMELGNGIKLMWGICLIGIMGLCFMLGCRYTRHKEYY